MNRTHLPVSAIFALFALAFAALPRPATATESPWVEARALTLRDCLLLALQNNLDLRIQRLTHQETALGPRAAAGAYDPSLLLGAARSGNKTTGTSPGTADGLLQTLDTDTDAESWQAAITGLTPLTGLQYKLGLDMQNDWGTRSGSRFDTTDAFAGLTLTQPLLKGLRTDSARYALRTAEKQTLESLLQLETRIQHTLNAVENAWYSLIAARKAVTVRQEALRLAEQLYADNKNKVAIGTLSRLDEQQAASQTASAHAALAKATHSAATAQNALKTLVFADQRATANLLILTPTNALDATEAPILDLPEDIARRALENRPDLRQARIAIERQQLAIDRNRDDVLPSLDLSAAYGWSASGEDSYSSAWSTIRHRDQPEWKVGLTLTVPLPNRTARANLAQSRLAAERLRLDLARLEEAALVEVADAALAVQSAWAAFQASREATAYAFSALVAEQRKYERGKSTPFVVLQLQKDLTAARNDEIAAATAYRIQRAALALAEGATLAAHGLSFDEAASLSP